MERSARQPLDLTDGDGRWAQWGWGETVASAKFVPPPLPRHWIRRDRLCRRLSQALERRLTVVTGPPGAGKTVLLADWAHSRPQAAVGWLSVEEADNSPRCFWPHVATALGGQHAMVQAWVDDGPSSDGAGLVDLLSRHRRSDRPQVLVIDDFHLITAPAVISALARFVYHLPPHLRVVLVGQGHPGFSLPRLETSGEAMTLGEGELRFAVEEAAALTALAAGKFLGLDDVTSLTQRSEGWAAGLYLAAMALANVDDPSTFVRRYSGSFGPVAEYLEHEMLLRQPPEVVKLLLQTSVLDSFTADLGQAVSGRPDAGEILESLADRCLFVYRVDAGERRYRYHRLLADLLTSRLQREDPSLSLHAHLSAATWLERRGDFRRAAYHFAQAQAYDRALMLLFTSRGHGLASGDSDDGATCRSAGSPGETGLEVDLGGLYVRAATLLAAYRVSEASQLLGQLREVTAGDADGLQWRARIDFLWAIYADRTADALGVLDNCRATAELMGPTLQPARASVAGTAVKSAWLSSVDAAIAAHLPILTARAQVRLGRPDQAQAILIDHFGTEDRAEASQPATLAVVACSQGRLQTAYRLANAALHDGESAGVDEVVIDARLVLAEVFFEHNELGAAEQQVVAALLMAGAEEANYPIWAVELEFVRVLIAQQRLAEALHRLGRLRQAERRSPPPHHLLQKLNQVEIGCRINTGDLDGALLMARAWPSADIASLTLARLDLRSGRPEHVLGRLSASASAGIAAEIRRLVLVACAEEQQGQAGRARETLGLAVATARPEHYVRPFLEEAPQTLPLLRGIAGARPDGYLTQLVGEAERLVPSASVTGSTTMIEPLTDRERQVLDYLPSHLSRNQIAGLLCVSSNTVKTHIQAVYRKIGATSRAEAVTVARSHGLLAFMPALDGSPGRVKARVTTGDR